jgi:hypothetical protein
MRNAAFITAAIGFAAAGAHAADVNFDFASPVPTANSQTPGAWYTDRYAPAVFESAAFGAASDGFALRQGVRSGDAQANRTGGFAGDFYNYQGRKYDLGIAPTPIASVAIDLFVDSNWTSGTRAGMWTTMANGNLTYPIIEYVVDGDLGDGNGASYTGFRFWQSGIGWTAANISTAMDDWSTLQITLDDSMVNFFINGTHIASVDNLGAESISNIILQAHNQGLAGEYDVYWDNLVGAAIVPLPPAAWAGLGMLGTIAGVRAARRR